MLRLALLLFVLFATAAPASAAHWEAAQAARLGEWLDGAANEALPSMSAQADAVRAAATAGDPVALDDIATRAALTLGRALRMGVVPEDTRARWNIAGDGLYTDFQGGLTAALANGTLDQYFAGMRPSHPFYGLLQQGFVAATDPARKTLIAANMERWRWMPHAMGDRYLFVNAATFEVTLWEKGVPIRRWPVIVGKKSTPTPVFAARITGVVLNPWWEIPNSIVAESVGSMMRRHPAAARRKGYVIDGGRYRQRPGPTNSLGQMKLVMPNPYNVYLHDTPSKQLFEREVRAFSHGCIRVGGALDLATTLLSAQSDWPTTRIEEQLASGKTSIAQLSREVPVYITYFTAEPDGAGGVRVLPDIYQSDYDLIRFMQQ
jgi:hypothetical protein